MATFSDKAPRKSRAKPAAGSMADVPLTQGLVQWVTTVGQITPFFLHAGWQSHDARGTVNEPKDAYAQVSAYYNERVRDALSTDPLPTYGQFGARMAHAEAAMPAALEQAVPELNPGQAAALADICSTFRINLVQANILTRLARGAGAAKA